MQLSFHGAARCVTGSKHLLTLQNQTKVLFDCGMFQGMGSQTDELNSAFGFDAASIDYLLLSHAHIDHSGLIPRLVKEGFSGKIFCTAATKELAEILLYDSAEIQTYELDVINSKRASSSLQPAEPLYTAEHVEQALQFFNTCAYNEWIVLDDDIDFMFTHTGHLIGSAAIHCRVKEAGQKTTITFSGDVGRYRSTLLQPPAEFFQADYIILESTYGDKQHEMVFNTIELMEQWIKKVCVQKQGKIVIPAFSVGRTQEVLYILNQLSLEKRLPDIPFYVDSPMSHKATKVIKSYTGEFNDRLQKVLTIDDDPFDFAGLNYIATVEESRQLVNFKDPCVIISASGTCDAGRVRHHIAATVADENNAVLLVGHCQPNSLGGQLLNETGQIEVFGNAIPVNAEIGQLKSMSAHGDFDDLIKFLSCQDPLQVKKVFLVHGEYLVQQELSARLQRKGFNSVEMPGMHYECQLESEPVMVKSRA